MTEDKQKKIADLVYKFLSIVDSNSKFKNRTYYADLFASMSDDE
jgi:hypothetical protein